MKPEILNIAVEIVDNNSGGMKFMELLPAILERVKLSQVLFTADELLDAIKADPRFNVLEYYWKLDEDTVRVKYFITLTYGKKL